jgi:DNA ligase 1
MANRHSREATGSGLGAEHAAPEPGCRRFFVRDMFRAVAAARLARLGWVFGVPVSAGLSLKPSAAQTGAAAGAYPAPLAAGVLTVLPPDAAVLAPIPAVPAPALLLARRLDRADRLDISRYLVSEKLDGVRAYWTGRELLFRRGGAIAVPRDRLSVLPTHALDGELWLGRGRFDEVSALLRRGLSAADSPLWRELRYAVFEWPDGASTFLDRAQALQRLAAQRAGDGFLLALEQQRLPDAAALEERLREVVTAGGEGLMLHQADAPYLTGRSEVLFKHKPEDDAEATVTGYLPGQGRLAGRVGALRVRDTRGREFAVGAGLSDALRTDPPPIGATITYRHRGWTSTGLPRFATYWRSSERW